MTEHAQARSIPHRLTAFFLAALSFLSWISIAIFFAWSVGAIHYLTFLPTIVRNVMAVAYAIAIPIWVWRSNNRQSTRGWIAASIVVVYLVTLFIRPSNDRVWDPDQTKVADVRIENGRVTIDNFRHCQYRSSSDYDVHFETKQFSLDQIESVWFIVQKFTADEGVAHVFLSFGLRSDQPDQNDYFSVSVEIRREVGEVYSPLQGLYRNYELTHVIGDERDLIGVRTVHRPNDRVYLYPVNATPDQAQELFVKFAERIQSLRAQPQFYHTLLNNCANGITGLTYELTPEPINWLDTRIVLPGYSGQFGWETGLLGKRSQGQSFEQLESVSRIDERAKRFGITDTFSQDIRMREIAPPRNSPANP